MVAGLTTGLNVSSKSIPCFVTVESTVRLELVMENPFAGHDVCVGGWGDEFPRVVGEEGAVLIGHRGKPVRVF